MPQYRFTWDNIPPSLLRRLGEDLDLPAPIGAALLKRYGARPSADFVRDAWPALLDRWLTADRRSRERIISGLIHRRPGAGPMPPRTDADQLRFLRAHRYSATLRDVVAAAFRALGEPRLVGAPTPPAAAETPPDRSGETLDEWLGWVMTAILGADDFRRDQDGDIPVRAGSTMCYVRSVDDPPSVRLFSPMVVDVPRSGALLEAINEINMSITVGRVFHTPANEVIFAIELYGEQLTVDIIRESLAAATTVADHFDHRLQSQFGGKTMFAEMNDDSVML